MKRLVDAHGGRIFVNSQQGSGAEFTVFLPVAPEASPASVASGANR